MKFHMIAGGPKPVAPRFKEDDAAVNDTCHSYLRRTVCRPKPASASRGGAYDALIEIDLV